MAETKRLWTGRIISGFAVLFLIFDGSIKLFKPRVVLEATAQLGFPTSTIVAIGLLLLACTALYVIPRTAALGAVLLTGYLGGAVAAHVRVQNPMFETIFPILVGSLVWIGIYLRDERVRALISGREQPRRDHQAAAV
jgi:hypothetical protein